MTVKEVLSLLSFGERFELVGAKTGNCGARIDEDERTLKYADQDTMMPAT